MVWYTKRQPVEQEELLERKVSFRNKISQWLLIKFVCIISLAFVSTENAAGANTLKKSVKTKSVESVNVENVILEAADVLKIYQRCKLPSSAPAPTPA